METLIRAAVQHARSHGAKIVEAYPIDMQSSKLAGQPFNSYSGYKGVASTFRGLGFKEVGQASETQLIMRLDINGGHKKR